MRGRSKPWAVPYLREHPELVYAEIPENDAYLSSTPVYLEIGMGKGDFLIGMSAKKEGHFLGIERDLSVLATAAKKIESLARENIRLVGGDFDDLYEGLSTYRFDEVYLNFSDPWPKKRHAKRRLTEANRLKKIASLLKDGGRIVMKTDNPILYEYTLEQVPLAGLKFESFTDHYEFDEESDAMSEYEARFRAEEKPIHRLIIVGAE